MSDVTVVSVSPSNLNLEIDVLSTITVPVEVQFEGSLPEGYWRSDPELTPQSITLKGAQSDLEKVSTAMCYINLTDRTSDLSDPMRVVLMDSNGVVLDSSAFTGDMPSVIAKMTVLPKKTVSIDVVGSLLGADKIAAGYQVLSIQSDPATVEIAAAQEVLDSIDTLAIESVDLQNASESILTNCNIKAPEGVQIIGSKRVELYVEIAEKTRTDSFYDIPIEVRGLDKGLNASLNVEKGNIKLTGVLSALSGIKKNDLGLYVDATGLGEGIYTLEVKAETGDALSQLETEYYPLIAQLTLTKE